MQATFMRKHQLNRGFKHALLNKASGHPEWYRRAAGLNQRPTISALGPNHGGPSGDGRALIVASVGKSSGNAVETQGNTPDGISNDRTIRRLQPHGHCLDWEKPGRSAQPVAVSSSTGERVEGRVFESPAAT